ncbi:MAG: alpha/beta hydrolase [Spirochaetota bacterium]
MDLEQKQITANGLNFAYLQTAKTEKPIVLLHGFPETPHIFGELMQALAAEGYWCIAPFLRGYAPSSVPQNLQDNPNATIQLADLCDDIFAILDGLGIEDTYLLGHDWGSIISYTVANKNSQRIKKLITISIPPLSTILANSLSFPKQWLRSWYIFFFQTRLHIPEFFVRWNNYSLLKKLYQDWSPDLAVSPNLLEDFCQSIAEHSHLNATLAYYRGLLSPLPEEWDKWQESRRLSMQKLAVPTLLLSGKNDGCMGSEMYKNVDRSFSRSSKHTMIASAGHFLLVEAPEKVYREVSEFLQN